MRLALTLTRNLQSKLGTSSSSNVATRAVITSRNYTILSSNPNNNNSQSFQNNAAITNNTNNNKNNATKHTKQQKYTTHSQLPSEHQMVYEMCRKFADEELAPNAGEWDRKHEFPREAVDKLVRTQSFYSTVIKFVGVVEVVFESGLLLLQKSDGHLDIEMVFLLGLIWSMYIFFWFTY